MVINGENTSVVLMNILFLLDSGNDLASFFVGEILYFLIGHDKPLEGVL